ncbi:Rne/Rng family ribonuclease [Francisella sp. Scap27]|uniref:Rne/Rng family ribonuclease n=1 Tax=Francisella sp. Scap27 TaxID=2589986 RepID=UPI0015BE89A8|nr:Rne/Rng family ribonuclease [Francisella sp. Scap27]QLE78549.1 Rne/Rng family ribonuclease [Francisella sp. Scap27]
MKKILINSKSNEETRIATLDNGKLIDLDIENVDREQKKANIYKGYISRIEPSLNAIFVNYGEEKNGFLPFKEVSEYYLKDTPKGDNIAHLLSEGQELIVQIDKEERGDKGAALTTFITLAGSYMVLLPNNPSGGGISRRVEGEDREKLKKYLKDLNMPKNMSVIARTACVECTFEELKHDFDTLAELWSSISRAYHKIKKPTLLHKESDIIIRTVRDHLKEDVKEIVVDSKECFEDVKRQLGLLRQSFNINKVKLYDEDLPIFAQFGIDQQIENAYKREIRLPSGGSIVIDTTEALVAVDVNSSRANKAEDVETTAFKTNMEAAEEVARQLRIRDLGGLVIIDFIDMSFFPNRKQVEEKLMEALQQDKARIQMSRISKLGLVEISRQRLSSSLSESVMQKCPRCEGHGFIKTTQATALTILRKVRAEAMKDDTNEIRVQVPVDIAAYILNEKRDNIVEIEKVTNVKVMLIPNFNLEAPKFQMQRIWGSSYKSNKTSPDLIEEVYSVEVPKAAKKTQAAVDMTKVVKSEKPQQKVEAKQENNQEETKQQAPKIEQKEAVAPVKPAEKKGFFSKLFGSFANEETKPQAQVEKTQPKQENKSQKPVAKEQNKNHNKNENKNNDLKKPRSENSNRSNQNDNQKQEQRPRNNEQRDNNRPNRSENNRPNNKNENNRNDKSEKGDRNNRNDKRNDKFDKKSNNRNNSSNRSSNLNLNNAEEVVDITKVKYANKVTTNEVDNIKKVISKNPDEFMSVMVTDVLENYDSLKDDGSAKITTTEKGKTHKYLRFNTVSVDAEIKATETKKVANEEKSIKHNDSENVVVSEAPLEATVSVEEKVVAVAETTTLNEVEVNAPKEEIKKPSDKKQKAPKQEKTEAKAKDAPKQQSKTSVKEEFINYSPAVDFESQSIR